MTWDPSQPTAATKLRNLSTVIPANWDAIESGLDSFLPQSINFNNRTPLAGVTNDPPALGDAYKLYCKTDAAGNPELYGRDEAGTITQFSFQDRTLAQTGFAVLPMGILVHWGVVTMPSLSRTAPVTFSPGPNYSATPWVAFASPNATPLAMGTGSNARVTGTDSLTTTGFNVKLFNGDATQATPFAYLVLGPV